MSGLPRGYARAAASYDNASEPEQDDRVADRAEELAEDWMNDPMHTPLRESLTVDASETLDSAQYEAMFAAMADAEDSGLIAKLAQGDPLTALQAHHLDVFARVARIAAEMAAARKVLVDERATAAAERESRNWPVRRFA